MLGGVSCSVCIAVFLFIFPVIFLVFVLNLSSSRKDASLPRETFSPEPPTHAFGTDVDGGELEVPVAEPLIPPVV